MESFCPKAQHLQQARYLYTMAASAYRGDVANTLSQLARHYEILALAVVLSPPEHMLRAQASGERWSSLQPEAYRGGTGSADLAGSTSWNQ